MSSEKSFSIGEIVLNFTDEFSDSFLYAYILQIILIIYMYSCVGSGRYWKIMLAGAIFGVYGAMVEHVGTAWLDAAANDNHEAKKAYYCYFFSEIGWIATEFCIPYLNLIKLNTLTQTKLIKIVNYAIFILFILFAGSRFCIGYLRVSEHSLYNTAIYHAHGVAFGITAVADGLLSILIFIELNKSAKKTKKEDGGETFNLLSSFKKSSLFILFVVDLMSVILAILSIFSGISPFGDPIKKLIKPFHALKSNFILILAVDAFIFKMRATVDGTYVVSQYLKRQTKPCSNQGEFSDETPLSSKLLRSKGSNHVYSANTMTNSTSYNFNVSSISPCSSMTHKPTVGQLKSGSSISDVSYHQNGMILSNMEVSNDRITANGSSMDVSKSGASMSSVTTLNDANATRGYMKGKK